MAPYDPLQRWEINQTLVQCQVCASKFWKSDLDGATGNKLGALSMVPCCVSMCDYCDNLVSAKGVAEVEAKKDPHARL